MGDRSKSEIFAALLGYVGEHGLSLGWDDYSPERGLRPQAALEFIDLLQKSGVRCLGFDLWRKSSGKYRVDGSGVWASNAKDDVSTSNLKAKEAIAQRRLGADDVFVIVF